MPESMVRPDETGVVLTEIVDALGDWIPRLPERDEWKFALMGIRRHMATAAGLPLARAVDSSELS